ncbi:alpha/beta hydrolase [Catellatospora sp. TT07R-123]|uniref:alpha/beta fold hydrolase n=1 Tax=Catellatospora sp. TT07R-123 TaxID=2733863 RepID=UPI001B073D33|nr:alpha/beta hydrolase [Catellatospora sp. TT07R-123]GHJ45474.1 alpha/beta hydrolase [Catellatospora sp. TT07R-123]
MTVSELWYQSSGTLGATPVVLLHGLTGDATTWQQVTPLLAERAWLHVVDLRGHGASPRPGRYSAELMRDDVVALLDLLDLDRVVLVGHSLGGVVSYLMAQTHPDRVAAVVLEDPPPPRPLERTVGPRPDGPLDYDWDAVPAILGQVVAPDPGWWPALATITAPALVVGGARSHMPQDWLAEMAAQMPRGRYLALDADHGVHAALPAEFAAAVHAFLDEHGL